MSAPKAPKSLQPKGDGRSFWRQILADYELNEPQDRTRLECACQCLDRIKSARQVVETEGEYYIDRFGQPKAHPAIGVERDQKVLFCRIIREMRLDIEQPDDTRLPRNFNE